MSEPCRCEPVGSGEEGCTGACVIWKALETHWLDGITCDHERGLDNPRCACMEEFLGWHPSVGAAVKAWRDHVWKVARP